MREQWRYLGRRAGWGHHGGSYIWARVDGDHLAWGTRHAIFVDHFWRTR